MVSLNELQINMKFLRMLINIWCNNAFIILSVPSWYRHLEYVSTARIFAKLEAASKCSYKHVFKLFKAFLWVLWRKLLALKCQPLCPIWSWVHFKGSLEEAPPSSLKGVTVRKVSSCAKVRQVSALKIMSCFFSLGHELQNYILGKLVT
jgi:hypothetical protein